MLSNKKWCVEPTLDNCWYLNASLYQAMQVGWARTERHIHLVVNQETNSLPEGGATPLIFASLELVVEMQNSRHTTQPTSIWSN